MEKILSAEFNEKDRGFGKFQPIAKHMIGNLNIKIRSKYAKSESVGEE